MKKEIMDAYDRMNPPRDAKERMMQNLLRKQSGRRRGSASIQEKWNWSAIPAAILLIGILSFGGWVLFRDSSQLPLVSPTEPVETENMASVPSESNLADAYQDNQVSKDYVLSQAYAHVIEKYSKAYQENWSHEQYMENDICYVLKDLDFDSFGYTTMDLNGDDTVELIITDGNLIYDLYMLMDDGGAGHLISAGERQRYYLCEDNLIGYRGSSGASNSFMEFIRLKEGGDSEIVMYLQFDTDTWYKIEGGSDKMLAITEDDARHIQDFYQAVEIEFTPFLRKADAKTTYSEWIAEKLAADPKFANCYYAVVDLDQDGQEELLIGTQDKFGQVYTIRDGKVESVLDYGTDESFALCEGNVIKYHENEEHGMYRFLCMTNLSCASREIIKYDIQKESWYRLDQSSGVLQNVYITEDEVKEIVDSFKEVDLDMKPLSSYTENDNLYDLDKFQDIQSHFYQEGSTVIADQIDALRNESHHSD